MNNQEIWNFLLKNFSNSKSAILENSKKNFIKCVIGFSKSLIGGDDFWLEIIKDFEENMEEFEIQDTLTFIQEMIKLGFKEETEDIFIKTFTKNQKKISEVNSKKN